MNNRIKDMSLELKQFLNNNLALGKFIENCRNIEPLIGDEKDPDNYRNCHGFTDFTGAFSWAYSPENFNYWNELFWELERKEEGEFIW